MTHLFRHSFVLFARLVLGLMLFTQFSNLAQACAIAELNPAAAFSSGAMSDCDDTQGAPNKNACLSHCLQDYQVTQGSDTPPVPPAIDLHHPVVLHVALGELPRALPERYFSVSPKFGERPLYLRFSHFLN